MDISNKTLAILVMLAIIVSLVGLFIGRARIVTVGQAETTEGIVEAIVGTNVNIDITGTPISFGDVVGADRVSSESVCSVDLGICVDEGNTWDSSCPKGTLADECTRTMPATSNKKLTIESTGTTSCNIKYMANEPLFCKLYVHGASGDENAGAEEDPSFQAKVDVTSGSITDQCNSGIDPANDAFINMQFKDVDMTTDQEIALQCDQNDYFEMYFRIKVPTNEPPGGCGSLDHTTTLTFTGSQYI